MISLSTLVTSSFLELHWQMTACEKMALLQILRAIRPRHAVEVGTYQGGSLQVLSHFCARVDSIDIDPSVSLSLRGLFSNVTFHTGNSSELLPPILRTAAVTTQPVDFVLIDGDHSAEGVRCDINGLLSVTPVTEMLVLMHDAFNPSCREGILSADWQGCPHVHEVEVDFIPGVYHKHAYDTAGPRSMWGGFAIALLKPEPRHGELVISQRQQGLFNAVFFQSSHAPRRRSWLQRAKARLCPLAAKLSR